MVNAELEKVIESYQMRNQSIVIEGVHLTISFIRKMMSKYPTCFPFVLFIKNKAKHAERFAVRAKHMTVDPRFNKYISNLQHIRTIQDYLVKKAEEVLIPRVENHNVDRSVSLIQTTVMKSLHRVLQGGQIYDASQKRATGIHKVIQSIQKNQLSSKQAQSVIHAKVNKDEIVQSFLTTALNKSDFQPQIGRSLVRSRFGAS